jgi:hypothetical protein
MSLCNWLINDMGKKMRFVGSVGQVYMNFIGWCTHQSSPWIVRDNTMN